MASQRIYAVRSFTAPRVWYTGTTWNSDINQAKLMTLDEARQFVGQDMEEIVEFQVQVIRRPVPRRRSR